MPLFTPDAQTLMYNVKDVAVMDGVHDDSTAVNNYIANTPQGACIWFPPGTVGVGAAPLILLPNRSYYASSYGVSTIKQLNGANLNSVVCAQGYFNNNVFSDGPVDIRNLFIDGNWTNNTSGNGLVLMNSFSIVRQVWCNNIPSAGIILSDRSMANISTTITQTINSTGSQTVSVGSTTGMTVGMGLSVDPTGANAEAITVAAVVDSTHITANFTKTHSNGVTLSSILFNSSIENRVLECKIANCNTNGFWVRDNSTNSGRCTDNHVLNNVLSNCGGTGSVPTMLIERGAGHFIHRNHLYGCQATGISVGNAWSTFVTENEIDGYGAATDPTGQFWKGIGVTCIGPRATVISNNIISTSEPNTSTVYQHLSVTAGGSTTGRATITGNDIYGGGGNSTHSIGILLQSNGTQTGSGQSFFFVYGDNRIDNVGKNVSYDGASTSILAIRDTLGDIQADSHITANSTAILSAPTLAALAANGTTPPSPSAGNSGVSDVRGRVNFGSGSSPSAGDQVSITFNKAYSSTPVVVVAATNDAAAALTPYPSSISTTGFNIAFHVAPAASQGGTTYAVEYIVIG